MNPDPQSKPTSTLMMDVLEQLSGLVRGEVALARAELEGNIRAAGVGIVMIVAAVVFALSALNVLSAALVAAITDMGMAPGRAALVTGAAFALIAVFLALIGANALKLSSLAPSRTAKNMRRDAETLKEIISNDPPK